MLQALCCPAVAYNNTCKGTVLHPSTSTGWETRKLCCWAQDLLGTMRARLEALNGPELARIHTDAGT